MALRHFYIFIITTMYDLFEFFASFLTKIENGDNLKDYPIVCTFIEDGQQRERFIT